MSLYQLIGSPALSIGNLVDMGPGGHRYGIIQSIVKKDYVLPNPCMVTGAIEFYPQPVNLYLIRGIDSLGNKIVMGHVWGWTS